MIESKHQDAAMLSFRCIHLEKSEATPTDEQVKETPWSSGWGEEEDEQEEESRLSLP